MRRWKFGQILQAQLHLLFIFTVYSRFVLLVHQQHTCTQHYTHSMTTLTEEIKLKDIILLQVVHQLDQFNKLTKLDSSYGSIPSSQL